MFPCIKSKPAQVPILALAFFSVFWGCSIYIQCRPAYLPINRVINHYAFGQWLRSIPCNCEYHWLVYNLPDGLWVFAYGLSLIALAKHAKNKVFIHLLPLIIAFTHEMLQGFQVVEGTFDWLDLLTYGGFVILHLLIAILLDGPFIRRFRQQFLKS